MGGVDMDGHERRRAKAVADWGQGFQEEGRIGAVREAHEPWPAEVDRIALAARRFQASSTHSLAELCEKRLGTALWFYRLCAALLWRKRGRMGIVLRFQFLICAVDWT